MLEGIEGACACVREGGGGGDRSGGSEWRKSSGIDDATGGTDWERGREKEERKRINQPDGSDAPSFQRSFTGPRS